MNKTLEGLKSVLDKEIDKVVERGELKYDEIDPLGKVIDIYKDIETICAMEDYDYNDMPTIMRKETVDYWDSMSNSMEPVKTSHKSEKEEMISRLEQKLKIAKTEEERRSIVECIDEIKKP